MSRRVLFSLFSLFSLISLCIIAAVVIPFLTIAPLMNACAYPGYLLDRFFSWLVHPLTPTRFLDLWTFMAQGHVTHDIHTLALLAWGTIGTVFGLFGFKAVRVFERFAAVRPGDAHGSARWMTNKEARHLQPDEIGMGDNPFIVGDYRC